MADSVIHIWCEDRGHESVVGALVLRVAHEIGARISIETKNGEGGAARAVTEFKGWQRAVAKGILGGVPDILILVVDANSVGHNVRRAELQNAVDRSLFPHVAIGCPDPHIEAWLLVDAAAFRSVTGIAPLARQPRAGEDHKALFHASVAESRTPLLTGPMELAPDIIAAMDLDKAALEDRSLGRFLSDLRAAFHQVGG